MFMASWPNTVGYFRINTRILSTVSVPKGAKSVDIRCVKVAKDRFKDVLL